MNEKCADCDGTGTRIEEHDTSQRETLACLGCEGTGVEPSYCETHRTYYSTPHCRVCKPARPERRNELPF